MSEEKQDYIGYGEAPPEEDPPSKPKPTFDDIVKEGKHRTRQLKPAAYFIVHFIIAFGAGSIINYLVVYDYIRPSNVTQIIVSMLVFIYLRLNTIIGNR